MMLWCYISVFVCVLSFCFGKCLYSCSSSSSSSSSSSVVFYICCILCEIYTVYCVRRCSLALVSVDVNHITNDSGLSWRYYSRVRDHMVAVAWRRRDPPSVSHWPPARRARCHVDRDNRSRTGDIHLVIITRRLSLFRCSIPIDCDIRCAFICTYQRHWRSCR